MKQSYRTIYFIIAIALITSLTLGACTGTSSKKMHTIGVANLAAAFEPMLDGFKAGMEAEGFVEGENVTYLYDGPAANPDELVQVLEKLKSEKVDLVLSFGTTATLRAKQVMEGTDTPIVFGPVTDPIASGIVTDLQKPGGNITGIRTGNPTPKRLEWLMAIAPDIKRLYVFSQPQDNSSVQALDALTAAAPEFNVELEIWTANNVEEIDAGLNAMPEDVDAIFIPATAFYEQQMGRFVEAADKHKLPLAAPATANVYTGALTSFGHENVSLGKQASRLAIQILNGVKPADLPIENAELFVALNLKTARTIGLNIPDELLRRVDIVVR